MRLFCAILDEHYDHFTSTDSAIALCVSDDHYHCSTFSDFALLFICAIADVRYDHFTELAIALVMKESGYLVASL